jgi:hypothetical protein
MNDEYEKTDFAAIYFNAKQKACLLVSEAKRGRAMGEIGEPTLITDAEFDSRIGGLLLQHLDAYRDSVWTQETARRCGTPQESRAFTKKHLNILIARRPSGDLVITPMHHHGSGYTGRESEQIVVPKEDMPEKIPSALRRAFSIAT